MRWKDSSAGTPLMLIAPMASRPCSLRFTSSVPPAISTLPARLPASASFRRAWPLTLICSKVRSAKSGIDKRKSPWAVPPRTSGFIPTLLQVAERLVVEQLEHGRRLAARLEDDVALLRIGAKVRNGKAPLAERERPARWRRDLALRYIDGKRHSRARSAWHQTLRPAAFPRDRRCSCLRVSVRHSPLPEGRPARP